MKNVNDYLKVRCAVQIDDLSSGRRRCSSLSTHRRFQNDGVPTAAGLPAHEAAGEAKA